MVLEGSEIGAILNFLVVFAKWANNWFWWLVLCFWARCFPQPAVPATLELHFLSKMLPVSNRGLTLSREP